MRELIIAAINSVLGTNYSNEQLSDEVSLMDDLSFDSITLVRLIIELEEMFDVSMDDIESFSMFESIKTLWCYIKELTDAKKVER